MPMRDHLRDFGLFPFSKLSSGKAWNITDAEVQSRFLREGSDGTEWPTDHLLRTPTLRWRLRKDVIVTARG